MGLEQLLVVLPSEQGDGVGELTGHQWGSVLDQFAQNGGREVFLGGTQPLAYPGFWLLVRKCMKLRIPRVSAYVSGSLLEPWVQRQIVESGLHLLVALDGLDPAHHNVLHGSGSHARAMAALEAMLELGLSARVGLLATATRMNHREIPALAEWAAQRKLARMLWTTVPDGGWPSPQLRSLRLSPEEKASLTGDMEMVSQAMRADLLVSPVDNREDSLYGAEYSSMLRVDHRGEAYWGFSSESLRLGNLRRATLKDLLDRSHQAAGD